jgi:uncharacterized protein YndB with AHSA1/START domain
MLLQSLKFTVSAEIPASPERVYDAWLNDKEHGAMTGQPATAGANVGDSFTAHGDYIKGQNEELVPFSKIVQTWRTTHFSEDEEDSVVEVLLDARGDHTLLTLTHSNLPEHGTRYEEGWKTHYFKPMIAYFSGTN